MTKEFLTTEDTLHFDLVTDEYGNFYTIHGTTDTNGKLVEIRLYNSYFDAAFSVLPDSLLPEYKHKHVGVALQDRVLNRLKTMENKGRKLYSVQELTDYGVKVTFWDLTKPHPRSQPIK
ncbi:hypothetical protein LIT25_07180 [Bacillus sp. F19]|nr:hypothetical protein LIT25_07180 [Bacillus sp. F19]